MSPVAYDPSRRALYTPGERETIFETGKACTRLQLAIEAARLAYIQAEKSATLRRRLAGALARAGFGEPTLFVDPRSGTQGFGAYRSTDRMALIAIRGTQPDELSDLATDLAAHTVAWTESAGHVHRGFATAARALVPSIRDWLDGESRDRNALVLTGHSLGAAVATLMASIWHPTLLITLGSPRVGDAAFAATVAGIDGERIVDCCDVVTELPPESALYTHVRKPTYITKDGRTLAEATAKLIAADRLSARAEYLTEHAWKIGAVIVRDLADHAPINYARAFFR